MFCPLIHSYNNLNHYIITVFLRGWARAILVVVDVVVVIDIATRVHIESIVGIVRILRNYFSNIPYTLYYIYIYILSSGFCNIFRNLKKS